MTAGDLKTRLDAHERGAQTLGLMEKLGFSLDFVAGSVLSVSEVTVAQTAMLWQGMPNKHDRKRTRQLFDALSDVGLLEAVDDQGETWHPSV